MVTITWVGKWYTKRSFQWKEIRILIAARVQTAICLMTKGLIENERIPGATEENKKEKQNKWQWLEKLRVSE